MISFLPTNQREAATTENIPYEENEDANGFMYRFEEDFTASYNAAEHHLATSTSTTIQWNNTVLEVAIKCVSPKFDAAVEVFFFTDSRSAKYSLATFHVNTESEQDAFRDWHQSSVGINLNGLNANEKNETVCEKIITAPTIPTTRKFMRIVTQTTKLQLNYQLHDEQLKDVWNTDCRGTWYHLICIKINRGTMKMVCLVNISTCPHKSWNAIF